MALYSDNDVGIDRYIGKSGNYMYSQSMTGDVIPQPEVLVYDSIKQLYYQNYISGSYGEISNANTASFNNDGTISGDIYQTSFYNYEATTLNPAKYFPIPNEFTSSVEIGVIAVPSKLYGDYIKPYSLILENEASGSIFDDGEGRLYRGNDEENYVGNIIYQHGLIILTTDTDLIYTYCSSSDNAIHFSSSFSINEAQYKVTISPDEFNYSLNPTLLSGSEGDIYSFVTGSYFQPYITTVGLYNEKFELMAVAKLGKPLPSSRTTDTTILINIDIH